MICDPLETATILNNDLRNIHGWVEPWKMVFNPDPKKQASEVIEFGNNGIITNDRKLVVIFQFMVDIDNMLTF